jgi:hypothetical protein
MGTRYLNTGTKRTAIHLFHVQEAGGACGESHNKSRQTAAPHAAPTMIMSRFENVQRVQLCFVWGKGRWSATATPCGHALLTPTGVGSIDTSPHPGPPTPPRPAQGAALATTRGDDSPHRRPRSHPTTAAHRRRGGAPAVPSTSSGFRAGRSLRQCGEDPSGFWKTCRL